MPDREQGGSTADDGLAGSVPQVCGAEADARAGAPAVLVANRGEIAVRIMQTVRRMGLRSVAIHSSADPGARHVRAADSAVCVGGAALADSYLNGAAIVAAARASGARMVHPGYGFLSENADFARRCTEAGLVFIGPPPEAIEAMGDKIRAKARVAEAGVPLLPGFAEEAGHSMGEEELALAADRTGYPLLIKPSAGGGGKGMRVVREAGELAAAAAAARREAEASFGDRTLLVERLVENPRHIEVQVLADGCGNTVHLGERECSLQRRHQKIVEESPSPLLSEEQRSAMGEAAVAAAKACGYVGAGTVEFIVEPPEAPGAPESGDGRAPGRSERPRRPGQHGAGAPEAAALDYSFLEMNTRLQVEHPVTEAVASVGGHRGIDLVELQIRVARGEPLPFSQADVSLAGHSVESRVYAEDPDRGFLPTGGRVLLLGEPADEHVRVDSGLDEGAEITSAYDPMLAKVVTWAPDRAAALDRMDTALADYTLLGCTTNVSFLRALLRTPEVRAGALSTDLTERLAPGLTGGDGAESGAGTADRRAATDPAAASPPPPDELLAAAADHQLGLEPDPHTACRFDVPDGWRIGAPAWTVWRLRTARHRSAVVRVRRRSADPPEPLLPDGRTLSGTVGFEVRVDDGPPVAVDAARSTDGRTLTAVLRSRTLRYARAAEPSGLWLGRGGAAWRFQDAPVLAPVRGTGAAGDGSVRSPMPGTVLSLAVSEGERVSAGAPVAVVEAMKMEHTVTAPVDGTVAELPARPGRSVAMDALLARIAPESAETPHESGRPDPTPATAEE